MHGAFHNVTKNSIVTIENPELSFMFTINLEGKFDIHEAIKEEHTRTFSRIFHKKRQSHDSITRDDFYKTKEHLFDLLFKNCEHCNSCDSSIEPFIPNDLTKTDLEYFISKTFINKAVLGNWKFNKEHDNKLYEIFLLALKRYTDEEGEIKYIDLNISLIELYSNFKNVLISLGVKDAEKYGKRLDHKLLRRLEKDGYILWDKNSNNIRTKHISHIPIITIMLLIKNPMIEVKLFATGSISILIKFKLDDSNIINLSPEELIDLVKYPNLCVAPKLVVNDKGMVILDKPISKEHGHISGFLNIYAYELASHVFNEFFRCLSNKQHISETNFLRVMRICPETKSDQLITNRYTKGRYTKKSITIPLDGGPTTYFCSWLFYCAIWCIPVPLVRKYFVHKYNKMSDQVCYSEEELCHKKDILALIICCIPIPYLRKKFKLKYVDEVKKSKIVYNGDLNERDEQLLYKLYAKNKTNIEHLLLGLSSIKEPLKNKRTWFGKIIDLYNLNYIKRHIPACWVEIWKSLYYEKTEKTTTVFPKQLRNKKYQFDKNAISLIRNKLKGVVGHNQGIYGKHYDAPLHVPPYICIKINNIPGCYISENGITSKGIKTFIGIVTQTKEFLTHLNIEDKKELEYLQKNSITWGTHDAMFVERRCFIAVGSRRELEHSLDTPYNNLLFCLESIFATEKSVSNFNKELEENVSSKISDMLRRIPQSKFSSIFKYYTSYQHVWVVPIFIIVLFLCVKFNTINIAIDALIIFGIWHISSLLSRYRDLNKILDLINRARMLSPCEDFSSNIAPSLKSQTARAGARIAKQFSLDILVKTVHDRLDSYGHFLKTSHEALIIHINWAISGIILGAAIIKLCDMMDVSQDINLYINDAHDFIEPYCGNVVNLFYKAGNFIIGKVALLVRVFV